MLKLIKIVITIVALLLLSMQISACVANDSYQSRVIFAMNTVVELYISAQTDSSELLDQCESLIVEVESEISKTRSMSNVSLLNELGSLECGTHTIELIKISKLISLETSGCFDITTEPLSSYWNSLDGTDEPPNRDNILSIIDRVSMDNIIINGNTVSLSNSSGIDLGGIAKGYTAQLVCELIEKNAKKYNIKGGMLSFGGAVTVFGEKSNGMPYKISIRNPDNETGSVGNVIIEKGTVSVSGSYERYVTVNGQRYHHLIDPQTGFPAQSDIKSVAVISSNGAVSDSLSTALFIMGYDRSIELYEAGVFEFEALFIMSDGRILQTQGLKFEKK